MYQEVAWYSEINGVSIRALNFIKQVFEANLKLYTLIKNERVGYQELQIYSETKPFASYKKAW